MKFTLAELRISSTPIRIPTALRRVTTVTMPSENRAAPTIRKCGKPIELIPEPRTEAGGGAASRARSDDEGVDDHTEETRRRPAPRIGRNDDGRGFGMSSQSLEHRVRGFLDFLARDDHRAHQRCQQHH